MTLKIYLLGTPQISLGDQLLDLPGYRPLALLAYLLLTGKPQSRSHLTNLLFEEPDDPRAALRWTLSKLRQSIGHNYIESAGSQIAFNFDSDFWLDVTAVENGDLEQYRGELLEGLDLRDALQYEMWLLGERERIRGIFQHGLEKQLEQLQSGGDYAAVVETTRRLLQLDNLREDWHRALITAYGNLGKHEAALAQFEQCHEILRRELNVEPSPETSALAQRIQDEQAAFYRERASRSNPSNMQVTSAPDQRDQPPRRRLLQPSRVGILIVGGLMLAGLFLFTRASVLRGLGLSAGDQPGIMDAGQTPFTGEFAGTTVTVAGPLPEPGVMLFEQSMQPFEERTGIKVVYLQSGDDFEKYIAGAVASNSYPDIVDFPQPGYLAEFTSQGKVTDLTTFLDESYLRQQYPDSLLDAATVNGEVVGVWYTTAVKSLVWYPKRAFDAAGYEVPETWDDLLALSDQIVAQGRTPWCIGIESGPASGWMGTDWVEDILLRAAPADVYDAWVRGDVKFDSPEIRRVFSIMGSIWMNDRYVYGGTAGILTESWDSGPVHLLQDPPDCYLYKQGSFASAFFPEEAVYGSDYDFFFLPPIDPQFGTPVLGSGNIDAMFHDRPEVREVMRYLTTGESTKQFVATGTMLSPHRDTPFEWYGQSPSNLKAAQILLGAEVYRFDGSDLMPGAVGVGSFWKGMVDWVSGEDLGTVLQEIDASWPDSK